MRLVLPESKPAKNLTFAHMEKGEAFRTIPSEGEPSYYLVFADHGVKKALQLMDGSAHVVDFTGTERVERVDLLVKVMT